MSLFIFSYIATSKHQQVIEYENTNTYVYKILILANLIKEISMEIDVKKIIGSSSLTEKAQLQIIEIYEKIKKTIHEIEDGELVKIIEEETLLATIESLIQSISDNTLGKLLVSQLFSEEAKITEEVIVLSLRIRKYEGEFILYRYTNETGQDHLGNMYVDKMEQITYSDVGEHENGTDVIECLVDYTENILDIYLEEYISPENLPKWNIKSPLPIYYCSDYEEFDDGPYSGVLLTTLK